MQDDRAAGALTDAAIAREIETALAVEPSPEFLAGVRARIASEPAPAGWVPWWGMAAAAVLAIGMLAVMNRPAHNPSPVSPELHVVDARPIIGAVVPSPRAIAPRESGVVVLQAAARADAPAVPPRTVIARDDPKVLIPADERAVLRRLLLSGLPGNHIEPAPAAPVIAGPSETLATLDEITISPIAIEPLPPVGPPQGERQ